MRVWIGAVLVVGAALLLFRALAPELPPAERGRRLAQRLGCFGCHAREGHGGTPNPGRVDRTVPNFADDLMMYAKSDAEVAEWIREGATHKRLASPRWRAERERGALRMPAFGRRLRSAQVADLVAYVNAVAGRPEPADSLARRGLERAEALGCTGCHGDGGRLARSNPGSLKGYIPSWDGRDWPELVRDRAEFDQWVERGASERFERNALARLFLRRAAVRMPAYRAHLAPGDLDALWEYVTWLRSGAARPGD